MNRDSDSSSIPPMSSGISDTQRLGDFQLLRCLGKGGMAEVYLAEQKSLDRQVAIKILRDELLNDPTHSQRFEQEARAAGGLNHPNIVQVYLIGEHEGTRFIAQEYVRGMNLSQYLKKKGPPQLAFGLHIIKQVVQALQAAHDAGIVHRDVKPENILMTRKGEVKVADFGLAQLTLPGKGSNLTEVGVTMGTPMYMSPEQVNGEELDHRSDIYSLGVTVYHMLSGRPPFNAGTALGIAVKHVKDDAKPLEEICPHIPKVLCQIVHKLLEKKPDRRYQDLRILLKDIRQISKAIQHKAVDLDDLTLPETDTYEVESESESGFWNHFDSGNWGQQLGWIVFSCLVVASVAAGIGWLLRPINPLAP